MKTRIQSVLGAVALGAFTVAPAAVRGADQYVFLKEIPVGDPASWDYLSVDPAARRLYVSHGNTAAVIDLDKDVVVGTITNTPGIHGVALAPEFNHAFTSNGRENKANMVDLKTLEVLKKIETGQNPDGMLYEPGKKEVYLFNGRSSSATVINAQTGDVVATVPLDGKPEFGTADPAAGRVYDNLEDKSQVVSIDTSKHEVVDRWPVAPGEEPSGMALDTEHHRIFSGCGNKTMVMLDATTGKVVSSVPIGDGVDACAFDPGSQLAFASCGDGTVTIAHEDAPDKLTVVQTLTTQPRARTMTIDPTTHKIYLATAKYGPAAEGQRRPPALPGTFHIIVYGPSSAK